MQAVAGGQLIILEELGDRADRAASGQRGYRSHAGIAGGGGPQFVQPTRRHLGVAIQEHDVGRRGFAHGPVAGLHKSQVLPVAHDAQSRVAEQVFGQRLSKRSGGAAIVDDEDRVLRRRVLDNAAEAGHGLGKGVVDGDHDRRRRSESPLSLWERVRVRAPACTSRPHPLPLSPAGRGENCRTLARSDEPFQRRHGSHPPAPAPDPRPSNQCELALEFHDLRDVLAFGPAALSRHAAALFVLPAPLLGRARGLLDLPIPLGKAAAQSALPCGRVPFEPLETCRGVDHRRQTA